MDPRIRKRLDELYSSDRDAQNGAYMDLLAASETPVDWAYEVWDEIVAGLTDQDNHVRSIAAQLLANLARSDPDQRILSDFEALLNVTRDERFVTARHSLQAIWKVGMAGPEQRAAVVVGLGLRFDECANERNTTLVRYDILQAMRNLYDFSGDETIREKALAWIRKEEDPKYVKKYKTLWR